MTTRQERRAALDAFYERATGKPGSGLWEFVQRMRQTHQALITDGRYTGCACGEPICAAASLLAWCDELIASYDVKVSELAAETRRASALAAPEGTEQ
jgi:hypothetical protein